MRKNVRRALFYGFGIFFVIAVPFLTLFALGYTLDRARGSFIKTGGFFVKTNITGITITLNGGDARQANFFSRGLLVTGLAPGTYAVQAVKDGFIPWKKSISVREELVQEFRSVLLIPKVLAPTTLAGIDLPKNQAIVPLAVIPDPAGTKLFSITKKNEQTTVQLFASGTRTTAVPAVILPPNAEYQKAFWNSQGTAALLLFRKDRKNVWRLIPLDGASEIILNDATAIAATSTNKAAPAIRGADAKELAFSNDSSSVFYLQAGTTLYRWDREAGYAERLAEHIHSFGVLDNQILFVTESGFLATYDFAARTIQTLDRPGFVMNERPFVFQKSGSGVRAVIDSDGGLYLEHPETGKFVPIASNVSKLSFAPSNEALAYLSNGATLSTVLLVDEPREPFRKKYTMAKIFQSSAPIRDFIWFGKESSHLVFATQDGVSITEADTRFGANTVLLKSGIYTLAEDVNSLNSFWLSTGSSIQYFTIEQ